MKKIIIKLILPLIARYHQVRIKLSIFITRKNIGNENEQTKLMDLKLNGYVRIQDPKFIEYADYIEEKYFSNDENIFKNNEHIIDKMVTTANKIGNYACRVSFKDNYISSILFDVKIMRILNGYLGRCYYRENPLIEYYKFKNPAEATRDIIPYAVSFHADYYRQLNVMLLLSDITDGDTCTEYAIGSNQRNVFTQGSNIGYPLANSIIENSKYVINKISGKKGDLIIMDTTGIHRVNVQYGSQRKILVGIVNCSYPFLGYKENLSQVHFQDFNPQINSSALKVK